MTSLKEMNAEINQVRFIFNDEVVSKGFPPGTTLEDVACSLDTLMPHRDDPPIAIDVRLAAQ